MTTYVLENQRYRIEASIEPQQADGRWTCKIELKAPGNRASMVTAQGFVHLPVAVNDALQLLDDRAATLPDTERQVITLWIRQTNRKAWEGISDEKRDEMYQDERKARSGRKG